MTKAATANSNGRTVSEEHLGSAVEIAYETNELAAIPYEGWAHRAAEMLNTKAPGCIVAVTVASFEPTGALRDVFSEGAFYPAWADETHKPSHRISKRDLKSLNWWIRTEKSAVAQLHNLPANPDWVGSAAGAQWNSYNIHNMLVGLCKLPGMHPDRYIVIEFGFLKSDEKLGSDCSLVLGSVMPLLGARGSLAFNSAADLSMVTSRELEILGQIALGKSVKQIANSLDRSEHTIHDHVKSLHRKLNASSRGELVARTLGHLSPENSIKVMPGIRPSVASNRATQVKSSQVAQL